MREIILDKIVDVIPSGNLYKWNKVWSQIQKNYYLDSVYLRREKQIEDFVRLNGFTQPWVLKDTDILSTLKSVERPSQADICIITDQKFSRMPCYGIIEEIASLLDQCPSLFVCLNRHYINIDNSYCNTNLDSDFLLAITQWLKQELTGAQILDLSLDYLDYGNYFTWVVPDLMYYIKKCV
jgi:hypothetical protein